MDVKTFEYMKQRVEKAEQLQKAIEYRKKCINRLNGEGSDLSVPYNVHIEMSHSNKARFEKNGCGVDLGFAKKLALEAIRFLEEEIAELQKQLDEI